MAKKRVMASGVFDLLHLGHLHYLEEARKLGDELVVVVACDATVRKLKHEPITPEDVRLKLIAGLKPVDEAILGCDGDMFETVENVEPDIIALGHDQKFDEEELKGKLSKRGMDDIEIIRMTALDYDLGGTRKIIEKVLDWWAAKSRLESIEGPGKKF